MPFVAFPLDLYNVGVCFYTVKNIGKASGFRLSPNKQRVCFTNLDSGGKGGEDGDADNDEDDDNENDDNNDNSDDDAGILCFERPP